VAPTLGMLVAAEVSLWPGRERFPIAQRCTAPVTNAAYSTTGLESEGEFELERATNNISPAAKEVFMLKNNGVATIPSNHSVDETVAKLKGILQAMQAKGVTLFAVIDHSGEAAKVGMKMPNTKLLIFGNPKGGTPLMLASPSIAIDLPMKILVAEDAQRKVWISYNSPEYLKERHGLPSDLLANIAVAQTLATAAGE
jgi:uncharacterized protein (DUF302 family)